MAESSSLFSTFYREKTRIITANAFGRIFLNPEPSPSPVEMGFDVKVESGRSTSVDLTTECKVTFLPKELHEVVFHLPFFNLNVWIPLENIEKLRQQLFGNRSFSIIEKRLHKRMSSSQINEVEEFVGRLNLTWHEIPGFSLGMLRKVLEALVTTFSAFWIDKAMEITFSTDIPVEAGLGLTASICSSFACALLRRIRVIKSDDLIRKDRKKIYKWAVFTQSMIDPYPADVYVAIYGVTVEIWQKEGKTRHRVPQLSLPESRLILIVYPNFLHAPAGMSLNPKTQKIAWDFLPVSDKGKGGKQERVGIMLINDYLRGLISAQITRNENEVIQHYCASQIGEIRRTGVPGVLWIQRDLDNWVYSEGWKDYINTLKGFRYNYIITEIGRNSACYVITNQNYIRP